MIKSTKTSNKFANKDKLNKLCLFIDEYKQLVGKFVDLLWDEEKVNKFIPKEITSKVTTWLSARIIQCAAKQASGIVRGTKTKQRKRLWQINKFIKDGDFHKARKLQAIYNKVNVTKPDIQHVCPELDSRFIKIDMDNQTSFDGYITIGSIGNKLKLIMPFKKTKHFNKMIKLGTIKSGVRLSKKSFTFMFDIVDPETQSGSLLGIDIGKSSLISCSNGFVSKPNKDGHDLNTILEIMCRKKKGSKGFARCMEHRKNYINWCINQLNLNGVGKVRLERIKYLRKGKRTNRMLSHWTYTDIFDKLISRCKEQGVLVEHITPTYTSQRCSVCGWTRKSNRKGKQFKCESCGYIQDSDLNASFNIALNLKPIGKTERLLNKNRTGFYWLVSKEHIVSCVQKALIENFQ